MAAARRPKVPESSKQVEAADEQAEEAWLDQNGYVLSINRYNGSLVRGE